MQLTFINVLAVIILFQLLLLVVFLITNNKGKKISNALLAAFFFLLLINLADGLLAYYGFYTQHPALAHIEDGFVFLLGPVLYFYTCSVVYKNFHFKRTDIVHALPFLLITISYQFYYHFQTEAYQKLIQNSITHQTLPAGFYFTIFFIYGHVLTYILFAFKEVVFYRNQIRQKFSSVSKINLDWLMFMLSSIVFVLVISILYTFLPVVGLKDFSNYGFASAFIFLFVFTNAVVWKALKQPALFAGVEMESSKAQKYQASLLTPSEKNAIKQRLEVLMLQQKPFLNADLNIEQLAELVDTSTKKLSQVINESFEQTFYDYINSFRIAEAKRIFETSPDTKLTVLEVMYQSGFNSKSSFNTIFKQKIGMTPSAFRGSIHQ